MPHRPAPGDGWPPNVAATGRSDRPRPAGRATTPGATRTATENASGSTPSLEGRSADAVHHCAVPGGSCARAVPYGRVSTPALVEGGTVYAIVVAVGLAALV